MEFGRHWFDPSATRYGKPVMKVYETAYDSKIQSAHRSTVGKKDVLPSAKPTTNEIQGSLDHTNDAWQKRTRQHSGSPHSEWTFSQPENTEAVGTPTSETTHEFFL